VECNAEVLGNIVGEVQFSLTAGTVLWWMIDLEEAVLLILLIIYFDNA
jgi:hypothetical protein